MAPKAESPISKQKQNRDQPVGFYFYTGWRFVAWAPINPKKLIGMAFSERKPVLKKVFLIIIGV